MQTSTTTAGVVDWESWRPAEGRRPGRPVQVQISEETAILQFLFQTLPARLYWKGRINDRVRKKLDKLKRKSWAGYLLTYSGAAFIRHGGTRLNFYKWLGVGGTVSRRTANKKLTKLYCPSLKRSSIRLNVLV